MAPAAALVAPQPTDPTEINLIRTFTPNGIKNLRACLRCRIILTKDQFLQYGCPTCGEALRLQENEGRVLACTTLNYHGVLSMIRPGAFVSRFNGLENRRPGIYALTVQGSIPDYILHESEYEDEQSINRAASRSQASRSAAPSVGGDKAGDSDFDDEDLFSPKSDAEEPTQAEAHKPAPKAVSRKPKVEKPRKHQVAAAPAPHVAQARAPDTPAQLPNTPVGLKAADGRQIPATPVGPSAPATAANIPPTPPGQRVAGRTPAGGAPQTPVAPVGNVPGTPKPQAGQVEAELAPELEKELFGEESELESNAGDDVPTKKRKLDDDDDAEFRSAPA